jgi:hypothetical protein
MDGLPLQNGRMPAMTTRRVRSGALAFVTMHSMIESWCANHRLLIHIAGGDGELLR